MCAPKPPKIKPTDPAAKEKDPAIIRNPYLDNATSFAEARMGRNALRIDPGTPRGVRIPLPGSSTRPPPAPHRGPGGRNLPGALMSSDSAFGRALGGILYIGRQNRNP